MKESFFNRLNQLNMELITTASIDEFKSLLLKDIKNLCIICSKGVSIIGYCSEHSTSGLAYINEFKTKELKEKSPDGRKLYEYTII